MAKKTYIGINGAAKNVTKLYVGVNGMAKKVTKGYVGDSNGQARLFYDGGSSPTPPTPSYTFAGRTIYRHEFLPATVIEYNEFGTNKKIAVADAVHRGSYGYSSHGAVPGLNTWNHFYCPTNTPNVIDESSMFLSLHNAVDLTPYENMLTDAHFQEALAPTLAPVIQTAKAGTDALLVNGSGAASHCRFAFGYGYEGQLPNIYQLFVIYACGDIIDMLDPTTYINWGSAIGKYTANPERFPCSDTKEAWSSTPYDDNNANLLSNKCLSGFANKIYARLAIPIVEF